MRKLIAAGIALGTAIAVYRGESLWHIAVLAFAAFFLWPRDHDEKETAKVPPLSDQHKCDVGPLVKATTDYARIQQAAERIQDAALAQSIHRLQGTSEKILRYLERNPQRISAALRYIDYYQDRTASLLEQYLSLRETGVQTQAVTELRSEMITTFQGFTVAYEKQFEKLVDNEVLDMGAEMKAAQQMMQIEGIDYTRLEEPISIDTKAEEFNTSAEEKQIEPKETGWSFKSAGVVAGAIFLGMVGLFKVLDKGKER